MEAEELTERIAAFPAWSYRFEFDGGISTPSVDPAMVNRHEQRRRYFFEPLLQLAGGSLRGRRVLDLGCNAGFWSLAAVEAGADFVLGIDAKPMYREQAELVFSAKGIERDRYRFEQGNVLRHEFAENFDVVLCLGLLDHVAKPVELFELIARVAPQAVVIDTEISRSRMSIFELDALRNRENAVEHETVLIPSRRAVVELAQRFGFDTVALPHNMSDYAGMRDYLHQRRLAFVCSKGLSLDSLAGEQRPALPWWVTAARAAARGTARR
jgi:SAM-dependent methyltransferase